MHPCTCLWTHSRLHIIFAFPNTLRCEFVVLNFWPFVRRWRNKKRIWLSWCVRPRSPLASIPPPPAVCMRTYTCTNITTHAHNTQTYSNTQHTNARTHLSRTSLANLIELMRSAALALTPGLCPRYAYNDCSLHISCLFSLLICSMQFCFFFFRAFVHWTDLRSGACDAPLCR